MKRINWKKVVFAVIFTIILFILVWLAFVGCAYLIFNVFQSHTDNWFKNKRVLIYSSILWAILMCIFIYYYVSKQIAHSKRGLMKQSEFNKIGTHYLGIDDVNALSKGWIIDSKKFGSNISYKHFENSNSIVYGITRAGKTTGFVLPTIYSNSTSKQKPCFILTDKKDELYQKSADFLTKQGYRIWKLDISDAVASNCWNPLSEIWKDYKTYVLSDWNSEAKYIAHSALTDRVNNLLDMLFVQKEGGKDNPFWTESAKEFFAMILYANLDKHINHIKNNDLKQLELAENEFTLKELYKQFNTFTANMWIQELQDIPNEGLVHQHKSIITDVGKAEQTYAGIKASAMAALKFLTDATIQKISSSTDLPLTDYANQPTALFLTLPSSSTDKTKLSSIYLQSFLRMCSSLPNRENNKDARPIYLLADEIGNIEPISGLSDLITTGLSKKLRCMLVFQSKAQLKAKYPKDYEIIQDNCELLILIKTKDSSLASNLSQAFGTVEVKEKSVNRNAEGKITGTNWHTKTKPVLSETEILEMKRGKILVWLAGKKPIITNTIPIDRTHWYKKNIVETKDKFVPTKLLTKKPEEVISKPVEPKKDKPDDEPLVQPQGRTWKDIKELQEAAKEYEEKYGKEDK